jgi:hypothetical protein
MAGLSASVWIVPHKVLSHVLVSQSTPSSLVLVLLVKDLLDLALEDPLSDLPWDPVEFPIRAP